MRKLLDLSAGIGLVLLSHAAFASNQAQLEELQAYVGKGGVYVAILVFIVAGIYVYFMRLRDKRAAPLHSIFEASEPIHSVTPDTLVTDCVRKMTAERIGALVVMEGAKLVGIFTERDALNKVLGAGLDPRSTRVSAVMTKDPYCVAPSTTVREAMETVTARRFRHLPVVDDGTVVAVISSGDLTHWLVKDQMAEVQQLVELAARS